MANVNLSIIDYGMGNLRSVVRAWEHVGASVRVVDRPEDVGAADAIIFPGQGAIVDAMKQLKATRFEHTIRDWIAADKPFFGICLGMQVLFSHSEEGEVPGLGVFEGSVKRFRLSPEFKVPHMGWNHVHFSPKTPVDAGLAQLDDQFYFVHSYYCQPASAEIIWGTTEYAGQHFTSAIHRGKVYATQFHPEKSQAKGLLLYRNFLETL
ncbi:MAG: imidazole glycerol phosphate synthase subunit HisH [Opitutales bacterium]|nr:imidazole glycerol phosphate synthase subunit HisH [Opitutales bacterium]